MQNGFRTPETFTEIAAVFLSLTPVRDRMYKPRLQYWGIAWAQRPWLT